MEKFDSFSQCPLRNPPHLSAKKLGPIWHFWRMSLPGVTSYFLLGQVGLESVSFKLPKVSSASSEVLGFEEETSVSRPLVPLYTLIPV